MDVDVTPYVTVPHGIAKLEVYIVPTLAKVLRDGRDISRFAFLIASYFKYLTFARTESGEAIAIAEPHMTESDLAIIASCSSWRFLEISPLESLRLEVHEDFMNRYGHYCESSVDRGLAEL